MPQVAPIWERSVYELLTGRPPFQAANRTDILDQVRNVPPWPLRRIEPAVPSALEEVCLTCLEKDVGRRFPTAAALAEALQLFLDECEPAAEGQPPASSNTDPLDNQRGVPSIKSGSGGTPAGERSTRSWWPFRRKSK
jgi:serine/threonine protein kinase